MSYAKYAIIITYNYDGTAELVGFWFDLFSAYLALPLRAGDSTKISQMITRRLHYSQPAISIKANRLFGRQARSTIRLLTSLLTDLLTNW